MNRIVHQYVCLLFVFAMLLLAAGCASPEAPHAQTRDGETRRRIAVAVTAAAERSFEERVATQGTVLAKHYAMVSPRIDGIITDLYVDEGDYVTAHETPLFQIDKEVVTQAYEIALQDRKVAEYGRYDAEAQLVAAQAQYDKAKLDYERFGRLREQQAITPDAMEQMTAGYTVAQAMRARAETAVTLRAEQEKQAEAALAIARKRLDDSRVYSPLDGWISSSTRKQGEFAGAGASILRVVDPRILEISAFLPGEYYPRVKTGETQARILVSGIDVGTLPVVYKSPEIQEQLRTFEIKCLVESPPEGVAPGAIAQVEVILQTRRNMAVSQDVVQIRDGRTVVFVVEDDVARLVEVKTGLASDGWIEALDGTLTPGAQVITLGYNLVNDGTPVDVHREED